VSAYLGYSILGKSVAAIRDRGTVEMDPSSGLRDLGSHLQNNRRLQLSRKRLEFYSPPMSQILQVLQLR